jgi:hypothetical protein
VLKKAGIVVATSAAALLAVSPLAFAGDYSDHDNGGDHHHHHHHHSRGCEQETTARTGSNDRHGDGGFINVSRNAVQVPIQACNNNVLNNIGVGILGRGRADGGNNGRG